MNLILLIPFCLIASLHGVQDISSKVHSFKTPDGIIRIEVNTYNNQDNNTTNHSKASCSQVVTQVAPNKLETSSVLSSWIPDWSTTEWALALIGVSAVSIYTYINYQLLCGKSYLEGPTLWSSWYDTIALQDLLSIAPKEITHKLLAEIHRRHGDTRDVAFMLNPLLSFLREIDEEEALIVWYQKIYTLLEKLKMTQIIPFSLKPFTTATERLQRISYYKNLFYTWAREYATYETDPIMRSFGSVNLVDMSLIAHEMTTGQVHLLLQEHLDRITPAAKAQ